MAISLGNITCLLTETWKDGGNSHQYWVQSVRQELAYKAERIEKKKLVSDGREFI